MASKSSSKSTAASTGIDYSKWDRMQWSDDDDDDDDDEGDDIPRPRVTRLDAPSSVSCTASGEIVIQQQQQQQQDYDDVNIGNAEQPLLRSTTTTNTTNNNKDNAKNKNDVPRIKKAPPQTASISAKCRGTSGIPESWTEKGSVCEVETTNDGGDVDVAVTSRSSSCCSMMQLYWTQDRSTVTFRFALNSLVSESSSSSSSSSVTTSMDNRNAAAQQQQQQIVRGWSCRVPGILSYDNRTSAVGTSGDKPRLILTHSKQHNSTTSTFFEGELPYPVHMPQDDDQVDWSIERIETTTGSSSSDSNSKSSVPFLCVTLFKATPMAGMVLWWSRPFTSCPELAQMEWRHSNNNRDNNNTADSSGKRSGGSNESFQQAWDEAHRLFKEKRLQEKESL